MKSHCGKCGMGFEIGSVGNATKSTCPVEDCKRPFWHGIPKAHGGFVRIGMTPGQYQQFIGAKP